MNGSIVRSEMKPFPGFDQLFELHDPVADRPYRGAFGHPNAAKLSRAEENVAAAVQVTWAMGSGVPEDIVWTTSAHALIVSARVRESFGEAGLEGWKTYPVDVFDKNGVLCPGYAGLAIVGRCGRIDLERSSILLKSYPGGYFPHFRGHFFEESSWDGSDFCVDRPDDLGKWSMNRIVTRRVVDLLQTRGVSNVRCTSLVEVTTQTSTFEIGLAHLLPWDFQARIASAYREAGVPTPESVPRAARSKPS